MRRTTRMIVGVPLLALALAGCGGSSTPPAITIPFKSPALVGGSLPAVYTCDGKDISPPLEWGHAPTGTREDVVFVLGLTPSTHSKGYSISIEWAVAGLNPALTGISAGKLPAGAHVGINSAGKKRYSLCPKPGQSKHYQFALYALPKSVAVPVKFEGLGILRAIADPISRTATRAGGSFIANYSRKSAAQARTGHQ
jgi:phosphatidylethanolamine-binding protein (PEBP) family uncharacterized protein